MGILKLNNFESENNEESGISEQSVSAVSAVAQSSNKKSTITVTKQIEINTTGKLTLVTTEADSDVSDDFPNELRVRYYEYSSTEVFSRIFMDTTNLPYAKAFLMELTTKSGSTGEFSFDGNCYEAESNKKYQFDITEKIKTNNMARFEINPSGSGCNAEFYATGVNAPKVLAVVEVEKEPDAIIYNLKDFSFGSKAKGFVDLNDGTISTAVAAFSENNFAVPLNLAHIYAANGTNGVYGKNWNLNFNKKLKAEISKLTNEREFTYIDELGKQYDFKEKYYYIEDGKRVTVSKNAVIVDLNGNLSYGGSTVYKHQSCNGYTLIPEIKEFANTEYLEQRQSERIQLESYIQQLEPNLKTYCTVNSQTDMVYDKFNELTKEEYDNMLFHLSISYDTLLLSKSEALQLKSLKENLKQNSFQKNKLERQLTDLNNTINLGAAIYPATCNDEIDFELPLDNTVRNLEIAKIREQMAYQSAQANKDFIENSKPNNEKAYLLIRKL